MSTLELGEEMLELIKNEDDSSLENLYKLIKSYKHQYKLEKIIAEGENDSKVGRLYNQYEVQKMIEKWVQY